MPKLGQLMGSLWSYMDSRGSKKHKMTELEGRILAAVAAAFLLVIAVSTVFTSVQHGASGISSCKGIVFAAQRNACYSALANLTRNYSVCSLITSQAASFSCTSHIALVAMNISICSRLPHGALYASCIEGISYSSGKVQYCKALAGQDESDCAYHIAQATMFRNISTCNAIANSTQMSQCQGAYYYRQALVSAAPHYCSLLPNSSDYGLMSIILSIDNSTRYATSSGYNYYSALNLTPQGFCYYRIATIIRNESLCASTSGVASQLCYANFTTQSNYTQPTNITAICGSAPAYARQLCMYALFTEKAITQRNVSSCMVINGTSYEYSCIVSLARNYSNSSYCNYIKGNSSAQQACIVSAGAGINYTHGG